MVERQGYIDLLSKYKDAHIIKILSGVRRCGKSTLLRLYKNKLIESGVTPDLIVERNYAVCAASGDISVSDMYGDLSQAVKSSARHYFLLDEVQEIDGWEKAINGIFESCDADIYVTGSNSKLMSSEISTYLSGRYVSIPVYPLSYSEYIEFKKGGNGRDLFDEYVRLGGFPLIALSDFSDRDAYDIVDGIYSSVVTNDVVRRHKIVNIELFERIAAFVMDNVGKTFSANSIANFFKNEHRHISVETVYNYLAWLEKAFIVYRCKRYDLQGKSVLKTQEKFYVSDMSLKYAKLGFDPRSVSGALENIVFLELKRRGYDVYIGKNAQAEIDFVAQRKNERIYIQVCKSLPDNSDREIKNLCCINDNYPKFVLSLNPLDVGICDGIKIMYLPDFLLSKHWS